MHFFLNASAEVCDQTAGVQEWEKCKPLV